MWKQPEARVADLFFALGDATRLAMVTRLGADGHPQSATNLAIDAQVTRQAIVKHLQVLERAGLVTHERSGREVLYSLEARRLEEGRAFLAGISAGWDRALDRLRRLVEEPGAAPDARGTPGARAAPASPGRAAARGPRKPGGPRKGRRRTTEPR